MSTADGYSSLEFTQGFLADFASRDFTAADRAAFLRALVQLDSAERHPSLRVHQLQGAAAGTWSASASSSLRITLERLPDGRERLIAASKHYER